MPRKVWTGEEEFLILENIDKLSVKDMALAFNVSYNNMCEKLQRMKLKSKAAREILWSQEEEDLLNEHYAYAPADYLKSIFPNRTWAAIKSHATNRGLYRQSIDQVYCNYKIFDEWNEFTAYVIGLMLTDGHIHVEPTREYIQIELQARDRELLEKIVSRMQLAKPLYKHTDREFYKFTCANRNIIQQLISKGVPYEAKSYTVTFPKNVPNNLIRHLIRGAIDGDGWCTYRDNLRGQKIFLLGFCGTYDMVSNVKKFFPEDCSNNSLRFDGRYCYHLNITGKKAFKIAEWLYKDATIYMERKYNAYVSAKQKYAPSSEKSGEDTQ